MLCSSFEFQEDKQVVKSFGQDASARSREFGVEVNLMPKVEI